MKDVYPLSYSVSMLVIWAYFDENVLVSGGFRVRGRTHASTITNFLFGLAAVIVVTTMMNPVVEVRVKQFVPFKKNIS